MLSPPRTPTLSGLGGLSGAAQSDPYWSYRVESVQYLWNGRANPWEKAATLATWAAQWEWTADDFAQAAGVSVEEMRSALAGPKR